MSDADEARPLGPVKRDVLLDLGESSLVLPTLVSSGLEANDRAKYFLTLLQTARSRADTPAQPFTSLRDERLAAGVPDRDLDDVVERSRRVDSETYLIPHADRIHEELLAAITDMLTPLAAAKATEAPDPSRLDALSADATDLNGEEIHGQYVDRITSARREHGDSLHLLVMDAHRALNLLQGQIASETLDGAAVYGLTQDDSRLVAAFMAGVHDTERLKLDHPGLATTATRAGGRLLIQNDLGTTNAHVVVLAVENLAVTVTYTDVHRRRLVFFQSMLNTFPVQWSDAQDRSGGPSLGEHHLATGRYEAADPAALEAYLRHVGSRLVFVLDWNRARKRLGSFLPKDDAIDILRWAADNNVGHMAFLSLGGERLIYDAVDLAQRVPARYGEPLTDILGRDTTLAITRFALRAAAEGMTAGKSQLLIRDEVRVEVLRHVKASHRRLLDTSAEHATLIVECAHALQAGVVRLGTAGGEAFLGRAARRAGDWEHRADAILTSQRQAARRVEGGHTITALTAVADDAIDDLEEAVFLLTLLPSEAISVARPLLEPLAAITVMAAREYLKSVEIAREVVNGPPAEDLEDFLVAVDRVAALEHDADAADRMARAGFVTSAPEFRSLYIADSVSRRAEGATDALLRSVLGLRDHILGQLSGP